MAYCSADSLLLGGIPTRVEMPLASFVEDAADEIDAALGFRYLTPIVQAADGGSLPRPISLILARINRYLASGRYILAAAAGGEDSSVHAYGQSLIRDALNSLRDIASGKVDLDAKPAALKGTEHQTPMIRNAEARSNVDAFYEAYTPSDGMMFGPAAWPWGVGRLEAESGG